jgi:cyclophilin family peptidyl-prolyl cis-trans isomerase
LGVRRVAIFVLALAVCDARTKADVAPDPKTEANAPTQTTGPAAWGPALPEPDPEIARLERARDATAPPLRYGLDADGPARTRAALALGRIGGADAAPALIEVLEGADAASLVGLALLAPPRSAPGAPPEPSGTWAELEDAAWIRYAISSAPDERSVLRLALARLGGKRTIERFGVELEGDPAVADQVEIATALGIACSRGHALSSRSSEGLSSLLEGTERESVAAAAWAWSRCITPSAESLGTDDERRRLLVALSERTGDADPEIARLSWRGLAALGELPDEIPAGLLADEEGDWLVEVEAVRALGQTTEGRRELVRRLASLDLAQALGPHRHVVLEGFRALRRADTDTAVLLDRISERLDADAVEEVDRPRFRALLRCEVALLRAIARRGTEPPCDDIESLPRGYASRTRVEALLVARRNTGGDDATLGTGPDDPPPPREDLPSDRILLEIAANPSPEVAIPALEALADVDHVRTNEVLRAALASQDPGVLAAAAGAVAARSRDAAKRDVTAVPTLARIAESTGAEVVEARIAAVEALGALARDDADAPWLVDVVLPLAADPAAAVRDVAREALLGHPGLVSRFDLETRGDAFPFADLHPGRLVGIAGLRVQTEAGDFVISFDGVHALHNQANLVELARASFFDGTTFHRVVPGFVVQGGDPRGDGYGGPGHLVPCEWSNLRYQRGTVGMALAGKDTGGSQFFVTHAAQPHLDGRFTVVGRVSEGMDVVDRLLPGTTIHRVTVIER